MNGSAAKIILDIAVGAALAFALLFVFAVDKVVGYLTRATPTGPNTLAVTVLDDATSRFAGQKKLRLGVTPTQKQFDKVMREMQVWDDMGKLLNELGEGYRFDEVKTKDILDNPALLDNYDVLFFTCAPGGQELKDALAGYVQRGGVLYASDWRFDAVAAAFPDYVDQAARGEGTSQEVEASVVDPPLRDLIGPSIRLRFDLSRWKAASFRGLRVTNLIEGDYQKQRSPNDTQGVKAHAPFLVKFTAGKGTVVFTSFHNEKQNSAVEKKLLQYLVFSLVTAGLDSEVQNTISEGGFSPQRSNLLSTPREAPSVTKTYTNQHVGPLRFALAFRNEGAKLRVDLKAPDGRHFSQSFTSTAILEVPDAPVGEWSYTITAEQMPYENFPFTVTVGEKK